MMKELNINKQNLFYKAFSITTFIMILLLLFRITILNNECKKLLQDYNESYTQLTETQVKIEEKDKLISDLKMTVLEMNGQLEEVSDINMVYVDELKELRYRSELYDKYSYAILDETNQRTMLTYEEIKYGEQLMLDKGYDPDLLFGTIMVESRGNPEAINTSSGATGYGQFLDSTAEYVWVDLMGNDSYSSEIMKDGMKNIQMMVEYYDHLYSITGSTFGVIKQYSGNCTDNGAAHYLSLINSFTQKVGQVVQ